MRGKTPTYLKTGSEINLKFPYIENLIKDQMEVKSQIRWIQRNFMGVKFLEKINLPFNIELKESFKALDVRKEKHE